MWLAVWLVLGCAPGVPHPVSSRADTYCRSCHVGRAGAPSAHDKDGCVSCHDSTATGPYPALMPHRAGDVAQCALCHRDGTAGATVTPHLAEPDCYTCHQAVEYGPWPPAVPHGVDDQATCLDCHGDIDHTQRPSCTACHGI